MGTNWSTSAYTNRLLLSAGQLLSVLPQPAVQHLAIVIKFAWFRRRARIIVHVHVQSSDLRRESQCTSASISSHLQPSAIDDMFQTGCVTVYYGEISERCMSQRQENLELQIYLADISFMAIIARLPAVCWDLIRSIYNQSMDTDCRWMNIIELYY